MTPEMRIALRNVPADLYERVKARAALETPPGHAYGIEGKILQLLDVYARLGLAEILRRCAQDRPPP